MTKEEFEHLVKIADDIQIGKKLTLKQFKAALPEQLPFNMDFDVYLTGGLARNQETTHDIDVIIEPKEAFEKYRFVIAALLRRRFKRLCCVGFKVYETVRPTPLKIQIYKAGKRV